MILVSFSRFDRTRGAKDQIFRTLGTSEINFDPGVLLGSFFWYLFFLIESISNNTFHSRLLLISNFQVIYVETMVLMWWYTITHFQYVTLNSITNLLYKPWISSHFIYGILMTMECLTCLVNYGFLKIMISKDQYIQPTLPWSV